MKMEELSVKMQNGTATEKEKLELLKLLNAKFAELQAEVDAL